jgi:hypothetical protein
MGCRRILLATWVALLAGAAGCLEPQDQRPGLRLPGPVAEAWPAGWTAARGEREILLEVATPYLLPHSVTIWCAVADGELYVAARNPEAKRWPGWVADDPEVRLKIDGTVYEARLDRLDDPERIRRVRRAYAEKYDLDHPPPPDAPPMRYWHVAPRDETSG